MSDGRASRVGGRVAFVFGWVVLVGGLALTALLALFLAALFPGSVAPWLFGVPSAVACLAVGLTLVLGGRRLRTSGDATAREANVQAARALAARRGGQVTAAELSRSRGLPEAEADALLTDLARQPDGRVSLEVDDDGNVFYRFAELVAAPGVPIPRLRVSPPDAGPPADAEPPELEEQDATREPPPRRTSR